MALRMGRHPEEISQWKTRDVMLLAAQIRIEERDMDRRFGKLLMFVAAGNGQSLDIDKTFVSLANEKVETVDDGSRRL